MKLKYSQKAIELNTRFAENRICYDETSNLAVNASVYTNSFLFSN